MLQFDDARLSYGIIRISLSECDGGGYSIVISSNLTDFFWAAPFFRRPYFFMELTKADGGSADFGGEDY